METTLTLHDHQLHLLGTIQGFLPDAARVHAALQQGAIDVVALGVPPEDLQGLAALAKGATIDEAWPEVPKAARPAAGAPGLEGIHDIGRGQVPTAKSDADFEALDPTQARFLELLGRWGETRVPSPDLDAAFAWAQQNGRPIEALDLDDEAHAEMYIRHNKFRHVLRSGRILKRIAKQTFDEDDPYAFAVAWDAYLNGLPSLQAVEAEREAAMAKRLDALLKVHESVVAVVPAARFAGVAQRLASTAS